MMSMTRRGDLVYQLLERIVVHREAFCTFSFYNPFMLEVMGSNVEFSLVVFAPQNLVRYITKEQNVAFSVTRSVKKN